MIGISDNLWLAADSIRAHKLRAALTVLGLTMGVATLIAVMTLVQGANLYVEQKIADLGTNVFRIARTPFAVTDFTVVTKALRNRFFYLEDVEALAEDCRHCQVVGATLNSSTSVRYKDHEIQDATLYGHTPTMADIDTRTVALGRYFTEVEDRHVAAVCLIGDRLAQEFFPDADPLGRVIRAGSAEFIVIGTFEKIGSVLGQDQDKFLVVPMRTYLKLRGQRNSITVQVKAEGGEPLFSLAQDDARRDHARAPPRATRKGRRFLHRDGRELHLAVAEHQLGVLRGVRDDQLDFGGGRRHRDHERDAGERHGTDQGDRRAARRGRHASGRAAPVPGGKRAAMPGGRRRSGC